MRVPPGLSAKDFADAVKEFQAAVGKDWVFTSDEDVNLYRDAYSPFWDEPEERIASAAVAPDTVEEVQKVVRIANQYKVPIYPISTGRNLGYGGSAPNYSGSVVLDLKRMNRILDVSERNASALVEPGVSYFDLYRYIQDRNIQLWIDVPDPGWGSPVGNSLDHGGGYTGTSYRNHFDSHCGMEVVLPNGELLRTGMGAMPAAKTWQQYKMGVGPWIDGLFSQSNFGVVTKMGFWFMSPPDAYLTGTVHVPRHDDLMPLVDILNYLENSGVINGMPQLGTPLLQGVPEVQEMIAKGADKAALESYALQKGIPYWSVTLKFYGPEKAIREMWNYSKEKYAAIAGATYEDGEFYKMPLTAEQIRDKIHKPEFGVPSLEMFSIGARSRTNPNPTHGHIWFSPIIPRDGEAIMEANRVFQETAKRLDIPFLGFSLPTTYWNRAFIYLFGFPITRDKEKDRKMRESFHEIVRVAAEHGWGEYRTAPAFQDAVVATYSFNGHALRRFHETLKDAIDPNGIISPGRYGIWPKHLRKT
jgi:FAD/FMN-containing dehydrogenase